MQISPAGSRPLAMKQDWRSTACWCARERTVSRWARSQAISICRLQRWRIIWQEALRNALIPAVALSGVQLTFLIGGTVLIEKIFSYPGIGNMAIDAVVGRDLPLIQGVVLTFAVTFILINILVDISYGLLNPKVRHA